MDGGISRRGFLGSSLGGVAGFGALAGTRTETPSAPIRLEEPVDLWDLPTPALVVDVGALERNLDKMAAYYRERPPSLRPHAKTHKCPILARKQLDRGAIGICTAKVSEAEVMVDAGIDRVLVTSPVVTREKIERIVALAARAPDVAIVADRPENVRDLDEAAAAAGVRLSVFVDLNVGTDRTGIAMGRPAVELALAIERSPALRFGGLQAYAGHVQHLVGWEYRKEASTKTLARALETRAAIEAEGLAVPALSVGGTGTYDIDADVEGVTDVQVGSYLFMDVNYRNVGGRGGPVFDDFEPSLLVLATAISQPAPGRITVDAGYKAFATDHEPPEPLDRPGLAYRWAGDEHGILQFRDPARTVAVGEKLLFIASHCDPTVNLYDRYYAVREGAVEEIWPIAARGRSQ